MNYFEVKRKLQFELEVDIPGSKSITNRALVLAALSECEVTLKNILFSDDTNHMIKALSDLGNKIWIDREKKELKIRGEGKLNYDNLDIYVGNSGTTIRFLTSYLATGDGKVKLYGDERMSERPIKSLIDPLRELGIKINYLKNEGYPPFEIETKPILSNKVKVDGSESSQYITSLLISASKFPKGLEIELTGKVISKPYIKMSLAMMKEFGISYRRYENKIYIPNQKFGINEYKVEGDCSSASYFLAMALITNSKVKLNNYKKNSIQGDYEFLQLLKSMGLKVVEETENSITVQGVCSYKGVTVDLNDMPDMAQTLAVIALFATTPTRIYNVKSMRIKETDRITALKNEIIKIGGSFREWEDGFEIVPTFEENYKGAELKTYNDHRMAMALSLIGLRVEGVKILEPDCVSKTFPNYFELFSKIYYNK